ncbi:MAG: hypothetical protein ACHQAX_02530 [Gammaproteobacteria bacterium]
MYPAIIPAAGLLLILHRVCNFLTINHKNRNTSIRSLDLLLIDLNNQKDVIDSPQYKPEEIDHLLKIDAIYEVGPNRYKINSYIHFSAITKPFTEACKDASGNVLANTGHLYAHPARPDITYICPTERHLHPTFLISHYKNLKQAYKSELNQIYGAELASAAASLYLGYNVIAGATLSPINLTLTLGGACSAILGQSLANNARNCLIPPSYITSLFLPTYLPLPNENNISGTTKTKEKTIQQKIN